MTLIRKIGKSEFGFSIKKIAPVSFVSGGGASDWEPSALSPISWVRSTTSTMYQDSAGTTPVTGAGQDVGLRLDMSQGLEESGELLANGGFDTDLSGWSLNLAGGSIEWSDGKAVINTPSNGNIRQNGVLSGAGAYVVSFQVSDYVSGNIRAAILGGSTVLGPKVSANGVYTGILIGVAGTIDFYLVGNFSVGFNGKIDNVSVRKIEGNHSIQTTATARPTYETGPARLHYDIDDAGNQILPAISGGQIVIISPVGTWIDSLNFAGGTFTVGPNTYTGGPVGLMSLLGGAEIEIIILPTPMTVDEQAKMVAYAQGLGSAGLITEGANKLPTGDFESGLIGFKSDGDGSVSTYVLNTTNPISGTQDALLDVTVNDNNRPTVGFQGSLDSPLEMGKRYIFKVKMKPVSGTPSLYGYACGQAATVFPSPVAISEGQVSFIGGPATTQNVNLYFSNLSATYSVQIDDVEVREVILP